MLFKHYTTVPEVLVFIDQQLTQLQKDRTRLDKWIKLQKAHRPIPGVSGHTLTSLRKEYSTVVGQIQAYNRTKRELETGVVRDAPRAVKVHDRAKELTAVRRGIPTKDSPRT